jgi:hypothetical protein
MSSDCNRSPLDSPEYLAVLKSAARRAMPADMLAQAYRRLAPSFAALELAASGSW